MRPANVNLIKVDQAPPDERVIVPQAPAQSQPLIEAGPEQYTTKGYETSGNTQQDRTRGVPLIRSGRRQRQVAVFDPRIEVRGASVKSSVLADAEPAQVDLSQRAPSSAGLSFSSIRPLSLAISAAGIAAVASGIYLYVQGQALWERARGNLSVRTPIIEAPMQSASTPGVATDAPAPQISVTPVTEDVIVSPAAAPDYRIKHRSVTAAPATEPEHAPSQLRVPAQAAPAARELIVQILKPYANLRSGPGLEYPVIAAGQTAVPYTVTDWNERWFKIELSPNQSKKLGQVKTAWIRNDLVKLISRP